MTMATRVEIFEQYGREYWAAGKGRKTEILNAVSAVTRMHRKAAIRKFRRLQMRDAVHEDKRGKKTFYTPDVTAALKDIWEAGNRVCGELLHPIITEYVSILRRDRQWMHSEDATNKLFGMSEGTMKRRVGTFFRIHRERRGLSATSPSALKRMIPIFTGPWKDKPPGWGQIDTVVHCGSSLLGDLVYTLNYTDAATFSVFPRAQWNKGQEATRQSMIAVKKRLPFPWLGAHPDTGSEFINRFVMEWCKKEQIELSRSRPGKKNDNMYVEERNGHVVRKHVGYIRLDCPQAVRALNDLYDVLTPYLLHFVAVRRTLAKERIGARYRRTYEKSARTPYQRILAHPAVAEEAKECLRQEHATLNPLILKREIEKRILTLYAVQKRYGKSKNELPITVTVSNDL